MPSKQSIIHRNELKRRYREIDFVAELQKYWAYFDKWLKEESNKKLDRDAIEELKKMPEILGIIKNLLSEDLEQTNINDSLVFDYQKYLSNNVVSDFMKYSWLCPTIRNSLNLFNSNPVTRVGSTGTIYLTHPQYRKMYSIVREQEASEDGIVHNSLIDELYNYADITHVGTCFFRESVLKTGTRSQFFERCWEEIENAIDQDLSIIKDLRGSNYNPGICSDVIETLYLVRCKAVHGDLDFVDKNHNDVCRSAVFLLQRIIEDIISKEISLHEKTNHPA